MVQIYKNQARQCAKKVVIVPVVHYWFLKLSLTITNVRQMELPCSPMDQSVRQTFVTNPQNEYKVTLS